MIRSIKNQTKKSKSVFAGPKFSDSGKAASYRLPHDLETSGPRFPWMRGARAAGLGALAMVLATGLAWEGRADVKVNEGEGPRVGSIAADLNALGTETSEVTMACWQGGEEIFSADEFNTVLLGGLAGDTAITLTNNTNGSQALAISLDESLCFVTIAP